MKSGEVKVSMVRFSDCNKNLKNFDSEDFLFFFATSTNQISPMINKNINLSFRLCK